MSDKYINSSGLAHYDEKIKEVIDKVDTSTNTKVTQTPTSTDASYPLLLSPSGQTQETNTTSYFNSGVVLNPSTKTISANIDGNAATATNATSADKLNANAGSATKPTYFSDGVPKSCTYELNKTVPEDALFTDTIAVKSVEDTSIQLTDAKDANMLLNHAPVNMLNITITSQTINGVTITVNSDKSITVKGTNTTRNWISIGTVKVFAGQTFSFEQTKTVNGDIGLDGTSWSNYMYIASGTFAGEAKGIFTSSEDQTIDIWLMIADNTVVDCTYYPRVYYENKRYAYVPSSGYEITACGKNLVDVSEISTWDILTTSSQKKLCQKILRLKPNTNYTISQLSDRADGKNSNLAWLYIMSGRHTDLSVDWTQSFTNGCQVDNPRTITSDSDGWITIGSLVTITNDIQIQLEEGDTATTYEPFKGTSVSINKDTKFPLEGLKSLNGLTNIYNSYGATMDVSYANNTAGKAILDGLCNNSEIIHNNSEIIDNSISDKWDSTKTYYTGDYCIYNNSLWKCLVQNTSVIPEEGTYWTKVCVTTTLKSLEERISALENS